jgi:PTH2 family peptidyl-tRNA hydrolase
VYNTKQVIVIRKDLNMRKGKIAAQAAHASVAVLTDCLVKGDVLWTFWPGEEMEHWLENSFTKICVYVNSEEELLGIYKHAKKREIICSLIKDSGKTEFKEPTYTAVAVGPAEVEIVNKITGELPLL